MQLRLPMLAAAAALPHPNRLHSNADTEDFELAAQAQEDAEWTAAADRSIGAAAASGGGGGAASVIGVGPMGVAEGLAALDAGQDCDGNAEWLGRDFWVGLENAHQRIQAAHAQAE